MFYVKWYSYMFLTVFLFFGSSSAFCGNYSYKIQHKFQSESTIEPKEKLNANFFFFGIFQEKTIKVYEVCKDKKLIMIEDYKSRLFDSMLTFITLGIYTPTTIKIYCD